MASSELEKPTSMLARVHLMATKSSVLYGFGVQLFDGTSGNVVRPNGK